MGAARIYGLVRGDLPEALAFLSRRGVQPTGRRERRSRLDVQAADPGRFPGVDERLCANGIEITTLAAQGADDERLLRELHELESRTERDMPTTEESDTDPYERWIEHALHLEGRSPDWFWIALDGSRPVGLARLSHRDDRSAYNLYTGVDRSYRGRGIAKALKLGTVQWARENGVRYIYTDNDSENHAMLSINVALGYELLPDAVEVLKEIRPWPSAPQQAQPRA
jgi:RimJ/RimL family protein N-acetyltransferase